MVYSTVHVALFPGLHPDLEFLLCCEIRSGRRPGNEAKAHILIEVSTVKLTLFLVMGNKRHIT